MIDLLTFLWFFNTSQPAQSTLTARAPQTEFATPAETTNGFTVKFTVDLKKFEGEKSLLDIPEVLRVRLRQLIAAHPHCEWALADSHTAIQPLLVRDSGTALRLACELEAQGVWIPAIRPPTVPAGTARLRITLSATHNENDVLRLVDALGHAMEALA